MSRDLGQFSEEETARRRDEVIRKMANTPPQPKVSPRPKMPVVLASCPAALRCLPELHAVPLGSIRQCVAVGEVVRFQMKEMEQLIALLFPKEGPKLIDLKFFQGENAVKIEEFCAEAHAAFVQVDSGQSPAATSFPEELKVNP